MSNTVIEFLVQLKKGIAHIEDITLNEIIATMIPIESTSSINIHMNENPDANVPGQRALSANLLAEESLEFILAAFLEAYTLSLRLQRSGEESIPINRVQLNTHIRTIARHIDAVPEWYDNSMEDASKTNDYKIFVKEAYSNCKRAVENFNIFVDKINKEETQVIWIQLGDPNISVLELPILPPR